MLSDSYSDAVAMKLLAPPEGLPPKLYVYIYIYMYTLYIYIYIYYIYIYIYTHVRDIDI